MISRMNRQIILQILIRFLFLLLASYGIFYFSYKYYLPWPGQNDYVHYYPMYLEPLDFTQAQAPFVYRQMSALIANGIYQAGIFYPNEIQFASTDYEQRVFFSVLFSNYIALLLTAVVVGNIVSLLTKHSSLLPSLFASLLCFTAFFTQKGVLTGMAEGWSWFLLALGFYGYLSRRLWLVIPILCLSMMQRETIPIVFGTIAILDLLILRKGKTSTRFFMQVLASSILTFGSYLFMRTVWLPVSEYKEGAQLSLTGMFGNVTSFLSDIISFNISQELLFQGMFTQNTYLMFICLVFFAALQKRKQIKRLLLEKSYFLQISCTLVVLDLVGIASGIGNNIGRIAAILTPITAAYIVALMVAIEDGQTRCD